MIEVLIKYIQDKGFEVHVESGFLIIRKKVGGKIYSISWGISRHVLRPEREELLYYLADTTLEQLNRAIAEKEH